MRITLGMINDSARVNLQDSAARMFEAQNRASTGKRLRRPSDDVPGIGRSLNIRSELASMEQFSRNSAVANNLLSVTEYALSSMISRIQQMRSLAVNAANSSLSLEAREAIATQIDQIAQDLKSTANTQYLGRHIFSGSLTRTEAIAGNPLGSPPCVFQGDGEDFLIQIAPLTYVTANITADKVFNMNGVVDASAPDMFSTIESLAAAVRAGDVDTVSDLIGEVDVHLANVASLRSRVGGRINRLQAASAALTDSKLKIQDLLSATEDTDLAEAILDLQTRQNVYQAAVGVASRVMEMSLVNLWGR